jgi:Domain of unknown function (DUF4905)
MFSETGFIIGEDRDTEAKTVTFFCLNAANGDLMWKDLRVEESWWVGIEAVVQDRVYLHGYTKPDMPEHGKITAVDLGTGKILWRNDKYAFLRATHEKVYAFRDMFERRLYYELDATNGEFLGEFRDPPENLYELKKLCHGRTDFLYPDLLVETSEDYNFISTVIGRYCEAGDVRGNVEYLRFQGKLIFSFHRLVERGDVGKREELDNIFYVVDEASGKNLYSETLNTSTPAPVPDSFFADGTFVYFVRERKTLVALPIDEIK